MIAPSPGSTATTDGGGCWVVSVPGDAGRPIRFAPDDRGAGVAPEGAARILVVEDEYLVANDIETALAEAGFEVVGVAASADQAVRLARQEKPALAIVDIRLLGKRDGVDAAIEMAQSLGVRSLFATAHLDSAMRARAQLAAPLGWLAKPYRMEALVAAIRQALKDLSG